jgi:monoamine oxidase
VGGGIAGLTAALQLTDAGFAPTIYEAMGRFGGRMKSERAGQPGCGSCHDVPSPKGAEWLENQVTDVFGEFIDTGHETMRALARRFGLPLVNLHLAEAKGSTETYFYGGKYYTKPEADRDYRAVVKALSADLASTAEETAWDKLTPEGKALDAMSLAQWVETRVPGGRASTLGKLLETAYAIEFGADAEDQSAMNIVTLLGYSPSKRELSVYGESDETYRISGGVDRLPKAIVKHLEKRCTLELGFELTRVAKQADGAVVLSFAGKPDVVVDYAILTAPFAALRNVDLSQAGFDERKMTAIRELGYGKNGKLHLQFSERLWRTRGPWGTSNGQVYTDAPFQSVWESTRGQPGKSGILAFYTGGSGAAAQAIKHPYATADDLGVAADASAFLDQIEAVFPGLRKLWNGHAAGAMPHLNRFWGGAYSYYRVGQWQAFGGHEPTPQGNVFFAGEHTTQEAQGYMEGAALTGTAAGKAVARLLRGQGKKQPK